MSYTPWDIQAGRNIANMSLVGILVTLLTIRGCVGCLNNYSTKPKKEPNSISDQQRIVHEYYDSNTNELYNAHRVIVQEGTNEWIFAEEAYTNYFTEDFLRKGSLGHEVRFLKNKN